MSKDNEWHAASSTYLFPVRALSRHYRGKMVSVLRESATAGKLNRVTRADEISNTLDRLMHKDWVVYSKHCLERTQSIVEYLARYSHRIAISDQRIIGTENDQVYFRYKDYGNNQSSIMNLHYDEFIRRFLMHVLPKGLMRIRHYGFLANRCRRAALDILRKILAQAVKTIEEHRTDESKDYPCPKCHTGHLVAIRLLSPTWPNFLIRPG